MRVVVVALGKIGLPLAVHAARAGHDVHGVDIDADVVAAVAAGRAPFPGEPGLAEGLAACVADGTLRAGTDATAAVAEGADLVVVVPPLVVDGEGEPDWRALDAAVAAVGTGLGRWARGGSPPAAGGPDARTQADGGAGAPPRAPGDAQAPPHAPTPSRAPRHAPDGRGAPSVVVETTLPVGTTRERVAPALAAASGLTDGHGFHAAHSPERVSSGRVFRDLETYPKLVGGLDATGEAVTVARYRAVIGDAEVWSLGSAETAETTKLAETTYRDLNIAFANELAIACDARGVDVAAVIAAANSQPYSHLHRPGVAVGGHCIPVYPRFLLRGAPDARLPALARAVNDAMPAYAVRLLAEVHAELVATDGPLVASDGPPVATGGWASATPAAPAAPNSAPAAPAAPTAAPPDLTDVGVLVLGAAYRGGVRETAFSGVFGLVDALRARGARAHVVDPLYDAAALTALGLPPHAGEPVALAVVQADHPEYRDLGPDGLPAGVRGVVDGRDVLDPARFAAAGVRVRRIGRDGRPPEPSATARDDG